MHDMKLQENINKFERTIRQIKGRYSFPRYNPTKKDAIDYTFKSVTASIETNQVLTEHITYLSNELLEQRKELKTLRDNNATMLKLIESLKGDIKLINGKVDLNKKNASKDVGTKLQSNRPAYSFGSDLD